MSATNIAFLAASLILQLLLLGLLVTRRIWSQLRLFTVLLCFYAIRSVFLVVLFPWVLPGTYVQIYTVLSAVDVLLQIALAIEFSLVIVRVGERPYLPRALMIPAIFLVAAVLASGIAALLPAHSRAPADRAGIFTGLLFLGIFLWSLGVRLPRWQRSVLRGLAGIGAAGILTQVGRNIAAIHQDAHAYRVWSYSNAVVYLVVLVVWIAQCRYAASSMVTRDSSLAAADGDGSNERGRLSPQRPL